MDPTPTQLRPEPRSYTERKLEWRLLLAGLVATDTVATVVGVTSAGLLRAWFDDRLPFYALTTERHLVASVLVVPVLLLLFRLQGLYDLDHILAGTREYAKVAHAATYGVVIAVAVSYFAGGEPLVSRSWLLLVCVMTIGCVCAARFSARRVVRWLRRRGALHTRIIVVGTSTLGIAIAQQLVSARNEGIDIVGFLDEYVPLGQPVLGNIAVIGRPGDLVRGRALNLADEYILVPPALPHERLEEITRLMLLRGGPVVRMAVSSSDLLTNGVLIAERGSVPLVAVRRARIAGLEAVLKRGLDVVGATLALVLLAPLALILVGRAYCTGNRPLFYTQEIYGAGAQKVQLWLFESGVTAWLPLRGVPALLAVLTNRLSLVGPRPVACAAGEPVPPALWLTTVKPGITGPWRLLGAEATLADQEIPDLAYVRNYSIWEDFRILWTSIWRVRRACGAERIGRWDPRGTSVEPAPLNGAHLDEQQALVSR